MRTIVPRRWGMTAFWGVLLGWGVVVCSAQAARAELVILTNGDRIIGEIVQESASSIHLRRRFRDTNIVYVQEFSRSAIARIEEEPAFELPTTAVSSPGELDGSDSPTTGPAPALVLSDDEADELLVNTLQWYRKGRFSIVGPRLTRLINTVRPARREAISAKVEAELGLTLAEWAAETRLRAAVRSWKGPGLRLLYVTRYEMPALVRRLNEAYEQALRQSIGAAAESGPGSATKRTEHRRRPSVRADRGEGEPAQEARAGHTILEWLDRPWQFDGSRREGREMTQHVEFVIQLLLERMRLDPAVDDDESLRTALAEEKKQLEALRRSTEARAGGALTPEERAERRAAYERRWQAHRQKMEQAQQVQQELLQQAIEEYQRKNEPPDADSPEAEPAERTTKP